MASGPNPDKKKHANRKYGIAYNGNQGRMSFSRNNHLYNPGHAVVRTELGDQQNPSVLAFPFSKFDSTNYPHKWHKAMRLRRVPKVLMLSSYIFWFEHWDYCSFIFPNQVSGTSICNPGSAFGNYYAFSQWNVKPNGTVTNPDQVHADLTSGDVFNQVVCVVENPMAKLHAQLMDTFQEVAEALAQDEKDPIYVVIPKWTPKYLAMKARNITLTDWESTNKDWHFNSLPSYYFIQHDGTYYYPDQNSPENTLDFNYTGVPCLACPEPGFGTNVLHMYMGHWTHKLFPTASPFLYESWPFGPPGQMIADTYLGDYLGFPIETGLNGIRALWRDCGLSFGYMDNTDLVSFYDTFNSAAAANYKSNFYKYRNYATRLFSYDVDWVFPWNPSQLWADQHSFSELVFYFGYDTCCDVPRMCTDNGDMTCEDQADSKIRIAKHTFKSPDSPSITDAITSWFPPLRQRVEAYYNSLRPGTEDFYKRMVEDNGLGDYDVAFDGGASQFTNAGRIIEYARDHFAKNP